MQVTYNDKSQGLEVSSEDMNQIKDSVNINDGYSKLDTNIVFMGDSISVLSPPNNWIEYVMQKMNFANVNNLAVGGATWTHTSNTVYDILSTPSNNDNNVIWNQFNKLKFGVDNSGSAIPDIVFIYAGVNDSYGNTIGVPSSVFANGTTVLDKLPGNIIDISLAVRYVCENLLSEYKDVKIILASPMQIGYSANNDNIRAISQAIEDCGVYLSVESIRTDKQAGVYGFNEFNAPYFLSDGVHPNEKGAKNLAKLFAGRLKIMVNEI